MKLLERKPLKRRPPPEADIPRRVAALGNKTLLMLCREVRRQRPAAHQRLIRAYLADGLGMWNQASLDY
jgi:hypothetical protein